MSIYSNEKMQDKMQEDGTDQFISVDEIKVRCNIPMGRLESLFIRERMGKHTIAEVRAGIEPMGVENAGIRLTGQPLAVEADTDGEKYCFFQESSARFIRTVKLRMKRFLSKPTLCPGSWIWKEKAGHGRGNVLFSI
jgi:hypothetical protein